MTKFDKTQFRKDSEYLFYGDEFVARFKNRKGDMAGFIAFLVKNVTVEEYFEAMKTRSPLNILEERGYVATSMKRMLTQAGYPATVEGMNRYVADQVAKYSKR